MLRRHRSANIMSAVAAAVVSFQPSELSIYYNCVCAYGRDHGQQGQFTRKITRRPTTLMLFVHIDAILMIRVCDMAKTDAIHNTVRTVPENFLRLLLLPLPPSSNLRRSHGAHCRFTGNSQFYRKSVFNQKKSCSHCL